MMYINANEVADKAVRLVKGDQARLGLLMDYIKSECPEAFDSWLFQANAAKDKAAKELREKEQKTCKHLESDRQYYPAINDEGWRCCNCGAELGFRPQWDKEQGHLGTKVFGIAQDLHEAKFIYISNGSTGSAIVGNVMGECLRAQRYDQKFIIKAILNDPNLNPLAEERREAFYKERWQIE